ncbi:MAG: F0F1 ATP synthase subunit epsilon [Mariprofundales bacterium]
MSSMQVLVATAEREVYRGEAIMLIAPSAGGELGILPKHCPLLAKLTPGILRIDLKDGESDEVVIAGGFIEVQPDAVTILADSAERAVDIDEAEALAAQRRAKELLESKKTDIDVAAAEAELALIAVRLKLLHKVRK